MLNNRTRSHTFDAIADPMAPKLKTSKSVIIESNEGKKRKKYGRKGEKEKGVGKRSE